MNKTEAAEFLGIGVRSLERYTSAGKVQAQKQKVKTGFALDYESAELQRFKTVLDTEKQEQMEGAPTSPPYSPEPHSAVLARRPATIATLAAKNPASLANVAANDVLIAAMVTQAVAHKLVLTVPECQALTGFSRQIIRNAITDGGLSAKQIGKAWRVKRSDLETWIAKL